MISFLALLSVEDWLAFLLRSMIIRSSSFVLIPINFRVASCPILVSSGINSPTLWLRLIMGASLRPHWSVYEVKFFYVNNNWLFNCVLLLFKYHIYWYPCFLWSMHVCQLFVCSWSFELFIAIQLRSSDLLPLFLPFLCFSLGSWIHWVPLDCGRSAFLIVFMQLLPVEGGGV